MTLCLLPLLFVACFEFMSTPDTPGTLDTTDTGPAVAASEWSWVEASREVTCAIAAVDGTIQCWGDMDVWDENRDTGTDHTRPVPWRVSWKSLDSGTCEFCGISDADEVVCWGCRTDLTEEVPTGSFEMLETSLWTACAAPASGTVRCWGQHWEGGEDPDSWTMPEAPVMDISVARSSGCVVQTDGTVSCFGSQSLTVPSGTFRAIDAGEGHHCGLRTDGSVACWGDDDCGQVSDTPSGSYLSISSGTAHSCALDAVGEATCWGYDNYGQLEAPEGPFTQISGGGSYTCAIQASDGEIACWGYNHWEQFPD